MVTFDLICKMVNFVEKLSLAPYFLDKGTNNTKRFSTHSSKLSDRIINSSHFLPFLRKLEKTYILLM